MEGVFSRTFVSSGKTLQASFVAWRVVPYFLLSCGKKLQINNINNHIVVILPYKLNNLPYFTYVCEFEITSVFTLFKNLWQGFLTLIQILCF